MWKGLIVTIFCGLGDGGKKAGLVNYAPFGIYA